MGPITRICSAALATGVMLAAAGCAHRPVAVSALSDYARARLSPDEAGSAQRFAAALTAAPQSTIIAYRAYRAAIVAGDFALALRAAQTLEQAGDTPPEARLLFYIAALRDRDWNEAAKRLNMVAREPSLAFIAPQLGEWLSLGQRGLLDLSSVKDIGGANAYASESRALLALAKGDVTTGMERIKTMWPSDPYRAQSLRLAAAATLAEQGDQEDAAALLAADTVSTRAARMRVATGARLGIAVNGPSSGAAFVIARLSSDLTVEGSGSPALTLARLAQFADAENPRIALLVAGALNDARRYGAALALADRIASDPVYGDDAASLRIELLEALDRRDEALAAAEARAARSPNDAARLGDIETRRGNLAAAAKRFDAAIAQAGKDAPWQLWHAAGNAHLLAGDWMAARAALETAFRLAPEEPLVLNSLGFALVDHAVDVTRGKALLAQAAELRPDNSSIVDSLGWAAYKTGQFGEAVEILERAQALAPVEPEIGEHLGDAYWASGRRIDARYAWAAARENAPEDARGRLTSKIERGLP